MTSQTQIRVLVITNTFPSSEEPGANPCIKDQIDALINLGVKIDLMIIRHSNLMEYTRAAWRILRLNATHARYDIVHSYYGLCGMLSLLQWKYPTLVTFLGSDLMGTTQDIKSYRDTIIGKMVAKKAKNVIVLTEAMKIAADRNDAEVIPFGVNTDIFFPQDKISARKSLDIPTDEKLVLFPWDPQRTLKRYDLVEEAIRISQKTDRRIRAIAVYNQPREKVAQFMNACDLMVLASNHEGSPVAIREALACNLPIVSVDVGDVKTVIGGIDGCYICERDAEDISEKMLKIIQKDQRIHGIDRIKSSDVRWSAEQTLAIYAKIIA